MMAPLQRTKLTKSHDKTHQTIRLKGGQTSLPNASLSQFGSPLTNRWNGTWNSSPYTHNEDTIYLNPFTPKDPPKPHVETIFQTYELEEYEQTKSKMTSTNLEESGSGSRHSSLDDVDFRLIRCKPDGKDRWSVLGERDEQSIWNMDDISSILTERQNVTAGPSNENKENASSLAHEKVLKKQMTQLSQTSSTGPGKTKRFLKSFKKMFRPKSKKVSEDALTSPPDTKDSAPKVEATPQIDPTAEPLKPSSPNPMKGKGYQNADSESELEEPPTMIRERTPPKFAFDEEAYRRWERKLKLAEEEAKAKAEKAKRIQQAIDDDFPLMYEVEMGDISKEEEAEKAVDDVTAAVIARILARGTEKTEERLAKLRYEEARRLDIVCPPAEEGERND